MLCLVYDLVYKLWHINFYYKEELKVLKNIFLCLENKWWLIISLENSFTKGLKIDQEFIKIFYKFSDGVLGWVNRDLCIFQREEVLHYI